MKKAINDRLRGLLHEMQESFFGRKKGDRENPAVIIALMGTLIALSIVFERTIYIPVGDSSRYSLVFIITATSGVILGGLRAGLVGILADVIGSLMVYGNINPLITVCVFLSSVFFGLFLYKKQTFLRVVAAVLFDQILCSLILKTGALAIWYYNGMSDYAKLFLIRCVQAAIMIPIEIVVLCILAKMFYPYLKRMVEQRREDGI